MAQAWLETTLRSDPITTPAPHHERLRSLSMASKQSGYQPMATLQPNVSALGSSQSSIFSHSRSPRQSDQFTLPPIRDLLDAARLPPVDPGKLICYCDFVSSSFKIGWYFGILLNVVVHCEFAHRSAFVWRNRLIGPSEHIREQADT
jgi:hypothetical protein